MKILTDLSKMERRNGHNTDCKGDRVIDGLWTGICVDFIFGMIAAILSVIAIVLSIFSDESQGLGEDLLRGWIVLAFLGAFIIIVMMYTAYSQGLVPNYFLADIPMEASRRPWIIALMVLIFPFYFASRWRMRRWEAIYGKKIPELDSPNPPTAGLIAESIQLYQKFSQDYDATIRQNILDEKEVAVSQAQAALLAACERMRECKLLYDQVKADRDAYAEQTTPSQTYAQIQDEWGELTKIPGIMEIAYERRPFTEQMQLRLCVQVYRQIRSYVYDLGDYEIRLFSGIFECQQIRSGAKPYPLEQLSSHYTDQDGNFCFRVRELENIQTLMAHGNYIEAIKQIVDELHVLDPEDILIAPAYFQRVGSINL